MSAIIVKLGSAVVADSDGELRAEVLQNLCREIACLRKQGRPIVVVTSGAIARGMQIANLPRRPRMIEELQAASAVGQGKLFPVYDSLLAAEGVTAAQILLTFFDMSARTHYTNVRRTLMKLLEWNIVPVINENDTTTTDEISFGDNDLLAAQVAILLNAELLLLLTNTDGLYTADPKNDSTAAIISEVHNFQELQDLEISQTMSPLGSGGMRSKVVSADMATSAGIRTVIANGMRKEVIREVIEGGETGTTFHPQVDQKMSSFKLWLKHAKGSRGTIIVDIGAAKALRERGTSLLPVGIVGIEGVFETGDGVDVKSIEGKHVGKGLASFSSEELKRVKGLHSTQIRALIPNASEEAVHRDFFVVG